MDAVEADSARSRYQLVNGRVSLWRGRATAGRLGRTSYQPLPSYGRLRAGRAGPHTPKQGSGAGSGAERRVAPAPAPAQTCGGRGGGGGEPCSRLIGQCRRRCSRELTPTAIHSNERGV